VSLEKKKGLQADPGTKKKWPGTLPHLADERKRKKKIPGGKPVSAGKKKSYENQILE